jgi:hypothetical protein
MEKEFAFLFFDINKKTAGESHSNGYSFVIQNESDAPMLPILLPLLMTAKPFHR